MNFNRIRQIDKGLGVPLCFLLTLWRRVFDRLIPNQAALDQPPKKVLFIKLIEQGSTVLAYHTLKMAVDRLGKENVYFWVFDENRSVLDFLDIVSPKNVFVARAWPIHKFAWDIIRNLLRIRSAKIDTVVDLEQFSRAPAILHIYPELLGGLAYIASRVRRLIVVT